MSAFSHSTRGLKSKIKVAAWLVSDDSSFSGEKLNIAEEKHQDNSILFGPFSIALLPTDRVTWDSAPIAWTLP